MEVMWIGVIGTSAIVFILKFAGYSVPERFLAHPRILKINTFIPIALMSALVAVQTVVTDGKIMIDQRLAGVGIAVIALILKAPYPVVVFSAALTSAALYHFR